MTRRLTIPIAKIRKTLRAGHSKTKTLKIIFSNYRNTIHHTQYWKQKLKEIISEIPLRYRTIRK